MRLRLFLFSLGLTLAASAAFAQAPCTANVEGPSGSTYVSTGTGPEVWTNWTIKGGPLDVSITQNSVAGQYDPSAPVSLVARVKLAERPASEVVTARFTLQDGQSVTAVGGVRTLTREAQVESWTYGVGGAGAGWFNGAKFPAESFAASKTLTVALESDGRVVMGPWTVPLDHADRAAQLANAWQSIETQRSGEGCRNAAIIRPDWVRKPSGDAMLKVYPPAALAAGKSGRVTLDCVVTAEGGMRDCVVVSETEGGFGEAALSVAHMFKMRPKTADGQSVEGGHVRIPLAFWSPAL